MISETIFVDDELRAMICEDVGLSGIQRALSASGRFRSMREDGMDMIASGVTDFSELSRTIDIYGEVMQ